MKIKYFVRSASTILIPAALLFSCQKGLDVKTPSSSENQQVELSTSESTMALSDFGDDVTMVSLDITSSLITDDCHPIVAFDPSKDVYPHTLTVDYGAGCTNKKGITKSGKIHIYFTGPMSAVGSSATTTYEDYYTNGNHVEGGSTMKHQRNQENGGVYIATLNNRKVTRPNGNYVIFGGERRILKLDHNGLTSGFPLHGHFRVWGEVTGNEFRNGESYQWVYKIQHYLVYKELCDFKVAGKAKLDITNLKHALFVDYGDGTCDNLCTITINGQSHEATIPVNL